MTLAWTIVVILASLSSLLSVLLAISLHLISSITDKHFQFQVSSQFRWNRIIEEQRLEIRALTESLCRQDGKVYIHPSPVPDNKLQPPTPNPFKMKPNPPLIRTARSTE